MSLLNQKSRSLPLLIPNYNPVSAPLCAAKIFAHAIVCKKSKKIIINIKLCCLFMYVYIQCYCEKNLLFQPRDKLRNILAKLLYNSKYSPSLSVQSVGGKHEFLGCYQRYTEDVIWKLKFKFNQLFPKLVYVTTY